MPRTRDIAQKTVSWLAFGAGVVCGLYWIALFGQSWTWTDSFVGIDAAGRATLGLSFFAASFVALMRRRYGGLAFAIATPVSSFLRAYVEVRVLCADGMVTEWREPGPYVLAVLECAFWLPLYAPAILARKGKLAAFLSIVVALISAFVLWQSPWTALLLPSVARTSGAFLVLGAVWLGTAKLGWPPLVSIPRESRTRRFAMVCCGCVMLAIPVLLCVLAQSVRRADPLLSESGSWGYSCDERSLDGNRTAFTVRILRTSHITKVAERWAGSWAIGLVQERFYGLPRWLPRVVFLIHQGFLEGETYLVDSRVDQRFVRRFLPIVETGVCTQVTRAGDAALELRLLRKPPGSKELRIIGEVQEPRNPMAMAVQTWPAGLRFRKTYAEIDARLEEFRYGSLGFRWRGVPVPYARVRVVGPSGAVVATADREGIYEVTDLRPDDYELELLDVPATKSVSTFKVTKEVLRKTRIVRTGFTLRWTGSIAGTVRDEEGPGPALYVAEKCRHG